MEVIDNDEWDSLNDDSGDNMKRRKMIEELGKQKLCSVGEVYNVDIMLVKNIKTRKIEK